MTRAAWTALALLAGALMLAVVAQEVTILAHADRARDLEDGISEHRQQLRRVSRTRIPDPLNGLRSAGGL